MRGRDYSCLTSSLLQWIYRVSKKKGVSITVKTHEDGQGLTLKVLSAGKVGKEGRSGRA